MGTFLQITSLNHGPKNTEKPLLNKELVFLLLPKMLKNEGRLRSQDIQIVIICFPTWLYYSLSHVFYLGFSFSFLHLWLLSHSSPSLFPLPLGKWGIGNYKEKWVLVGQSIEHVSYISFIYVSPSDIWIEKVEMRLRFNVNLWIPHAGTATALIVRFTDREGKSTKSQGQTTCIFQKWP